MFFFRGFGVILYGLVIGVRFLFDSFVFRSPTGVSSSFRGVGYSRLEFGFVSGGLGCML